VALIEGQYQIGDIVMGPQTWYPLQAPPSWGPTDLVVNDVPRPGMDGLRVGRETRQGRVITFDIGVMGDGINTPNLPEMYDRLAALAKIWDNRIRRDFPSLCVPLTYCRAGQMRRVYGRPRRFAQITPDTGAAWIDLTADFQAIDGHCYDETARFTTVGFIAATKAGVRFPIRFPLTFTAREINQNPNPIVVGGTSPAWMRCWFFGPAVNPQVEFVGAPNSSTYGTTGYKVALNATLKTGEWVIVDPTPWGQIVRRSDGSNMSGFLDWSTPPLRRMRLDPGSWRIVYNATDKTGTSYAYVDWRNCYDGY
jgi:hypothetical protein